MRHHAFAAAMGLVTAAAVLAPCGASQAAGADPTGYWYKPDAERESKIQVFKCGPSKSQLCAKIAWLKNPNDSKGKALHDIRNENPSMRDRPIVGLQIFTGLAPSAPGTWSGKIYNPEDGHTYSATLTVMSRTQIKLRGCKAWLLCGEKQWLRTSAPPADVIEPTTPVEGQQIEASATPPAQPAAAPKVEAVAAADTPAQATPVAASAAPSDAAPLPQEGVQAMAEPEAPLQPAAMPVEQVASPAPTPVEYNGRSGYGFLSVSASPADTASLSGENVSSMMVMTEPLETNSVTPPVKPAPRAAQPVPAPQPKAKPIATAAVKPAPAPVHATTSGQSAPADATADATDPAAAEEVPPTQSAEASMVEEPPLTRRQKRLLRRQQESGGTFLPWR